MPFIGRAVSEDYNLSEVSLLLYFSPESQVILSILKAGLAMMRELSPISGVFDSKHITMILKSPSPAFNGILSYRGEKGTK